MMMESLLRTFPPCSYPELNNLLIATEKLLGVQPFHESKILIVAADQITGFQGLIINKPLKWSILSKLEQVTRTVSENHLPEILPGIYFLDHLETIRKIEELKSANQPVADYWFFFGYSSWEWKQLYDEIANGAWNLSEDGARHLHWP